MLDSKTETPFLTQETFQKEIEGLVRSKRMNHMDAVLFFCKQHDLDPEEIKKVVSKNLEAKIMAAAIDEGYIKKTPTLPI